MFLCKALLLCLIFSFCDGIFEDCDFYEKIVPNKSYFVYSSNYPARYPPGSSCRWYAVSPPNTQIQLTCEEFYIPQSTNCGLDKLGISRNGRIDLADVDFYCGSGAIDVVSHQNKMNIVFQSVKYSPGGSFFCHMAVKESRPRPPSNPLCSCYTNTMRIVGGKETGVNEYPMMAALVDVYKQQLFCGATIISQKFALSAAHCLINQSPKHIVLLVGEHDISKGNDTDSAKLYQIERFFIHPEYNLYNQKNDAALVAVQEKMIFDRKVGPACLPFLNTRDSFAGKTVTALGWGALDYGGPTSDKLLEVDLDVISPRQCESVFGNIVSEKHICTYRDEKDACQADSGGPLLWRDPVSGMVKVLGIISFGTQCALPYPGINTRVTSYLNWIKDTTGENFCIV